MAQVFRLRAEFRAKKITAFFRKFLSDRNQLLDRSEPKIFLHFLRKVCEALQLDYEPSRIRFFSEKFSEKILNFLPKTF